MQLLSSHWLTLSNLCYYTSEGNILTMTLYLFPYTLFAYLPSICSTICALYTQMQGLWDIVVQCLMADKLKLLGISYFPCNRFHFLSFYSPPIIWVCVVVVVSASWKEMSGPPSFPPAPSCSLSWPRLDVPWGRPSFLFFTSAITSQRNGKEAFWSNATTAIGAKITRLRVSLKLW